MSNSNIHSLRSARARRATVFLLLLLCAAHAQSQPATPQTDPLVDRILQPPLRSMPRIERAWDALLPRIGSRHETVLTDDGVPIAYTVPSARRTWIRPSMTTDLAPRNDGV